VRVLGATRDHMPARVRVTGGARLVILAATGVPRTTGDTIVELTTPAVLRVDGAQYRLVAEAMEAGTQVEVQGTAPVGQGYPRAASAAGPAPMLNFTRSRETHVVSPPVQYELAELVVPPDVAEIVVPPNVAAIVRVESNTGAPARVRVRGAGDIVIAAATDVYLAGERVSQSPRRPVRLADDIEVVTPAELRVGPRHLFELRFDKVDPDATITVRAFGGRGAAFRHLTCQHSGTIWVWQIETGAGTCAPPSRFR
jgi:hypothetical protein